MWKPVKTLFTAKAEPYVKLSRILLISSFCIAALIYTSKKAELNRYLLKKVNLNSKHSLKIPLNSASVEELDNLPGVGPKLAARIASHRLEHNGFSSIDEIKQVKGLSQKKFKLIEPYLNLN